MTAYYNEIDPFAAQWVRNLIAAGHIARGEVDERSIVDVRADDLRGFDQCHFFAGIGVWSYALRLAGWPDDRPVWTGSCPCQPFSTAGRGEGLSDERHLWPEFYRLISKLQPPVILGEQVASPAGLEWLDIVQADLERSGYAVGAADLCAAGVGAPHIRQRLYWAGHSDDRGLERHRKGHQAEVERSGEVRSIAEAGEFSWMADTHNERFQREHSLLREKEAGWISPHMPETSGRSQTNGAWRDADWLHCRDGKWRPVEPGTFPLAHGAASRVGRLRAYGNAIVPQVAQQFISAIMKYKP